MWMMWKDQQQYHRSSVFDERDVLDCCVQVVMMWKM